MNKTKDSGYLFAKMSSAEENGVGHIVITEKDSKTYQFDEGGKASEKQSLKKWILDNVMLLVTLMGVLVGIMTGLLIQLSPLICVYDTLSLKQIANARNGA